MVQLINVTASTVGKPSPILLTQSERQCGAFDVAKLVAKAGSKCNELTPLSKALKHLNVRLCHDMVIHKDRALSQSLHIIRRGGKGLTRTMTLRESGHQCSEPASVGV